MQGKNFLLALLIALLSGTAAIFEKASLRDASPTTVFTLRSLYMTLCMIGLVLMTGGVRSLWEVSGRTLGLIILPATMALAFLLLYYSVLKQDLASRVIPIISGAPLVTVLDGHPGALAWLGAVGGHRVAPLGVDAFGQCGTIGDLYRHYRIDAEAIVAAFEKA